MNPERRLIEDFIPIREISVEAAREKSIRKGHISTLHLWWARRPLVAARAAVFASLVAAPETHQKRTALKQFMIDLCKWETGTPTLEKARKQILEAQKVRLNLPENTPLDEVPPPKVLDMFAGGGAIPLEALRLGCETYAVDLNPVAHIIELCTLVYPQKYGKNLADEVEKWGNWVIENVRDEIGDLYPAIRVGEVLIPEGEQLDLFAQSQPQQCRDVACNVSTEQSLTPVAYLWTRTVKCPNPSCAATVPLVRQTWLCKKSKKYVALQVIPNYDTKKVEFKVFESTTENGLGFDPNSGSTRGNSICRHCGTTVKSDYVKVEGKGDRISQQLMAIVCTTPGQKGKTYLSATDYLHYLPDDYKIKIRLETLCQETGLTIPNEPVFSGNTRAFFTQLYGLDNFGKLFTSRQLLSLMTFVKWVKLAHQEILQQGYEEELAKAISTYLSLGVTKVANRGCSLGVWDTTRETAQSSIANGRLPMCWDFSESNPIGSGSGNYSDGLGWTIQNLQTLAKISNIAIAKRQACQKLNLPDSSLDTIITDPPYFDAVPYADLSDYFYVWLKRSIGHLYPEHFSGQLTPKKNEAIMEPSRHGGDKKKAAKAYEDMMHQAFCEANRVLKEAGMMVVVYAHKTTAGWSTLIDSLRRAKFTITEAWPLDTEQQGGLRGLRASLASSIFLVARKRTNTEIGDYAMDVQPQLKSIIQDRVKSLMLEGVAGADLIIACVGAGLRAYTQYDKVELPNGDELDANSFLDEVQKEVLETILIEVLRCDKKGVSFVDKPTQYYILWRYEYGEAVVDFDEANTLAKGVGVELDGVGGLTDGKIALIKKTKNQVQLRDYSQRGELEDLGIQKTEKQQGFNQIPQSIGSPPTLIDILHRLLWLAEHQHQNVNNFLAQAMPDATQLKLVAEALGGRALTPETGTTETLSNRTKEQQAIDTLLASWKRLVEDNLFTQRRS
ncbi:MAG TPA: adenine-specific DNA methylase [Planktothrix sp. UBA8407]|jgi:Adenine-specific DNA methylase containing a Zn-ribbon|nr:adenine-specific DNA methylase [Planktothrix sp. UBA8407]HBK24578.1 adenine-specific DNA methylase [Planktothrix sp. UBA10369]